MRRKYGHLCKMVDAGLICLDEGLQEDELDVRSLLIDVPNKGYVERIDGHQSLLDQRRCLDAETIA